ncbi:hypothetical protein ACE1TI_14575 [Alteribacillus sp. JSM 102045]|uniref:hypothetical protein n=1 Tax=Alteribacillus sp. JSM 102045 TaxID=1562101 RepID=UPI0035C246E4
MQLNTRFVGPANKEFIDDYVALLEFSMEAPDETGFELENMVEDIIKQGEPNGEYYFIECLLLRL